MQCRVQFIYHAGCPSEVDCKADPSAVMASHKKTAKVTQCPNEATDGEYCATCAAVYNAYLSERQAEENAQTEAAALAMIAEVAAEEGVEENEYADPT